MAYEEPDLPVAGNAVSTSGFGFKVRNSIIWLKEQIDALLAAGGAIIVYKRQGGDATNWNTGGTTNYTLSSGVVKFIGTAQRTLNVGSTGTGSVITFPDTFAGTPSVQVSVEYVSGSYNEGIACKFTDLTVNGVTVWLTTGDGNNQSATNMVAILHYEVTGILA